MCLTPSLVGTLEAPIEDRSIDDLELREPTTSA
jgi:hypothetical protein